LLAIVEAGVEVTLLTAEADDDPDGSYLDQLCREAACSGKGLRVLSGTSTQLRGPLLHEHVDVPVAYAPLEIARPGTGLGDATVLWIDRAHRLPLDTFCRLLQRVGEALPKRLVLAGSQNVRFPSFAGRNVFAELCAARFQGVTHTHTHTHTEGRR
jgi:hypothetical protein